MTTSASTNFDLTAQEIITYALRKINVTAQTEEPSADDTERARIELNMMLKDWMRYEQMWRLTEGYVNLLADISGYSLTPQPYRVHDVRFRDTNANDTPMLEMTRIQYWSLPNKTSEGRPTQWFFDNQKNTNSIFIWPVLASVTTETMRVSYQRRYEDVDTFAETVDIPQQYLGVVGHNLAARLADDYGRSGGHIDRIIQRAEVLLQQTLDDDREDFVQFVPDWHWNG